MAIEALGVDLAGSAGLLAGLEARLLSALEARLLSALEARLESGLFSGLLGRARLESGLLSGLGPALTGEEREPVRSALGLAGGSVGAVADELASRGAEAPAARLFSDASLAADVPEAAESLQAAVVRHAGVSPVAGGSGTRRSASSAGCAHEGEGHGGEEGAEG